MMNCQSLVGIVLLLHSMGPSMGGFPIPEPFEWDESFKVFYITLDDEHKSLFQAVFNLSLDPDSNSTLEELLRVAESHFKNEEEMMQDASFTGFRAYKQAHDDFLEHIKGWSVPVSDDDIDFAKEWLVNHIKVTDFKYKGEL